MAGHFATAPKGVILHGSRSGRAQPTHDEFVGTANYAHGEPNGYGWHATVGSDEIAIHMPGNVWGWNARAASQHYIAVEFAQPRAVDPIDDGQVRTFCWYFQLVRSAYPKLPLFFPTHAELDGTAEYGGYYDGKTDVFPANDPRTNTLRARIFTRMIDIGVTS